ncbi:hypothetical protein N7541_005268 [Penicillium brevicompactum]|uniref:Uncharacterized protein n=1 Tax=Penicillium brevicompactum TaxID=5074 RepID=A0A9W9QG16_PENBR|nr:uncharacterized protein N7506_005117 [Penicillium brevicompactum]KAJ5335435.1 hypothetical protein N7452_007838 [Penicillium brevicompactum]KAJ5337095.1 hypothetical protein N7506_005117 [Penicillium brevicompactum]KAJ5358110.1 hypothetical protein N7541_005268 [Penicillium brevicompactum]
MSDATDQTMGPSTLPTSPVLADKSTRAPKPASLVWGQTQEQDPETGFISPVSSSEALRTPNESRYSRHPSSPDSSTHLPPRIHSPASQIFERDVQEDMIPAQASPAIPAHIRTENYIPPVLEASSAAITDDRLDPDSVEIVTHSLHHPAGATTSAEQSMSSSIDAHLLSQTDTDDMSSSYGALDTTDVRRLSFISFADVVNAEHAETSEAHLGSRERLGDFTHPSSPLRSPTSSHALSTSPPTSIAPSFKGPELSPDRHLAAGSVQSPVSSSFGGDLNVETMRQALRKTGSGDLGGMTSQPVSSIGDDLLDRTI